MNSTISKERCQHLADHDVAAGAPPLALSIRQPWAWLILLGKDIENRTWSTQVRGRILIHASKEDALIHARRYMSEHPHLVQVADCYPTGEPSAEVRQPEGEKRS